MSDFKINEKIDERRETLLRYAGCIPTILWYQIVSKGALLLVVAPIRTLKDKLISTIPATEITNADIPYMFLSVRGILILLLMLGMLVLYMVVDVNAMVILADKILHGKDWKIRGVLKEAILSLKYMLHPLGILVVLYICILAPLTTTFYGITLTSSFYIPDFITSVIKQNLMYRVPYDMLIISLGVLGFTMIFVFHFITIRKIRVDQAIRASAHVVRKYWKDIIKRYFVFLVKFVVICLFVLIVLFAIPFGIAYRCGDNTVFHRTVLSFFMLHGLLLYKIVKTLFVPFQIMILSQIYESYTEEDEGDYIIPKRSFHLRFWGSAIVIYLCIFAVSILLGQHFEALTEFEGDNKIIAHRAGGNLAHENTVDGIYAAEDLDVYGSEIDVQRTKDGKYIVYHDDTMERLCGKDGKPGDYTQAELKKMDVKDTFNVGGDSVTLSTPEEILQATKGKEHLYLELKGVSADSQMAEDMYQLIKDYDMLDQVTVICLKYNIIEEMKEKHPDVNTGYLCYASVGDLAKLNCDQLLLEDELATEDIINEAHAANKEVFIWTLNSTDGIRRRLASGCDGIITDEVKAADKANDMLEKEDDMSMIFRLMMYSL